MTDTYHSRRNVMYNCPRCSSTNLTRDSSLPNMPYVLSYKCKKCGQIFSVWSGVEAKETGKIKMDSHYMDARSFVDGWLSNRPGLKLMYDHWNWEIKKRFLLWGYGRVATLMIGGGGMESIAIYEKEYVGPMCDLAKCYQAYRGNSVQVVVVEEAPLPMCYTR